jgi:hypothetical protein
MTFLLIMSTMGRTEELIKFFESLVIQEGISYRIYLCDQNEDGRLDALLRAWGQRFAICVVRSAKGLSRGRNAALAAAFNDSRMDRQGHVVAFPDDDCWYPNGLLEKVANGLSSNSALAGLTARSMTAPGIASAKSSPDHSVDLNRENLFRGSMGISYCIFLRMEAVEEVGGFDESLGVGSGTPWGAGEESDYLLRAMSLGVKLKYDPNLHVFHPDKSSESNPARFLAYARGHGRVLRLNGYSWMTVVKDTLIAVAAFVVKSLLKGQLALRYLYRAQGYIQGYRHTAPRPGSLKL